MENKWHQIWSRRSTSAMTLDLKDLIALDGFDSGAGKIEVGAWRDYVRIISNKLNLKTGDSVYEVGCGCGAFLYALREYLDIKVGGNDYAPGLVDVVQRVFPNEDFQCIEAANINAKASYDYVISNSVFHYFDISYGRDVLLKMLCKATRAVCILEIPDLETKDQAEKLRRDIFSLEEYEKKYAGLNHTYYDRVWFKKIADELGMRCDIFSGCIPNYEQNQFRFGCVIWK